MKKLALFSLFLLAVFLAPMAHSAWTLNVQVSPANTTATTGQTVNFGIYVTCSTSCPSMLDVYVTWGDGSTSGNLVGICPACGTDFSASHAYAAAGTYTGQVRVDDTLGNSGLGAFMVTVQDPAPSGGIGGGTKARPV